MFTLSMEGVGVKSRFDDGKLVASPPGQGIIQVLLGTHTTDGSPVNGGLVIFVEGHHLLYLCCSGSSWLP